MASCTSASSSEFAKERKASPLLPTSLDPSTPTAGTPSSWSPWWRGWLGLCRRKRPCGRLICLCVPLRWLCVLSCSRLPRSHFWRTWACRCCGSNPPISSRPPKSEMPSGSSWMVFSRLPQRLRPSTTPSWGSRSSPRQPCGCRWYEPRPCSPRPCTSRAPMTSCLWPGRSSCGGLFTVLSSSLRVRRSWGTNSKLPTPIPATASPRWRACARW
mmetsp:Transcript_22473/g.57286  ORF Transcript_22473/g.57286 Transcript_22473/m.57286 type:complete len:214 (-) Transcript_22473:504-1145(-)